MRKADARFDKLHAISPRSLPLRVRPEGLSLDNSKMFCKKTFEYTTVGINLLLGTLRCGLVPIMFLEESFILIRKPFQLVSYKSFFDGIKNRSVRYCSASSGIVNVKAYIKTTHIRTSSQWLSVGMCTGTISCSHSHRALLPICLEYVDISTGRCNGG